MMDLQEAALLTHGTAVGGNVAFTSVSTDSRAIQSGQLFVALRGDRFDAHDFVAHVASQGAAAAMVDRAWAAANPVPLPLIVVEDTRLGLGQLAAGWRKRFELPLVGITGSNGKTSVKTLLAGILERVGATHVNAGNLNNEIGLPISLLRLADDARFAVLEMGAGKPGDIDYLARIALEGLTVANLVRVRLV